MCSHIYVQEFFSYISNVEQNKIYIRNEHSKRTNKLYKKSKKLTPFNILKMPELSFYQNKKFSLGL